jgi:hypothetical protein
VASIIDKLLKVDHIVKIGLIMINYIKIHKLLTKNKAPDCNHILYI